MFPSKFHVPSSLSHIFFVCLFRYKMNILYNYTCAISSSYIQTVSLILQLIVNEYVLSVIRMHEIQGSVRNTN
jgi:hypothetical protein